MDGDMAPTCPESGAQKALGATAFAGFALPGQACRCFQVTQSRPVYWPLLPGSGANVHCRALSTAGPSSGIVDIHFPMRERPCSSGLAAFAGGAESGIDSGGTG